jgi:hypothetical protein
LRQFRFSEFLDAANPNGKPTASGDNLLATVTFTGLPVNNAAFGSKKASLYFNACKQDEKSYEIFFAKWGYNHPGGQSTDPNWFYYWKDGNVCGIGSNCIFEAKANTWGYCTPTVNSTIRLCDLAPEQNSGPESYDSGRAAEGYGSPPNGSITVTGQGKGIKGVAETIQHESEHLNVYALFHQQTDADRDGIPDSSETTNTATSYGGIASCSTNPDTYNMSYGTYSDQELRCRKVEMLLTINIYTNLDWANPGCQSKNKYGP